MPKYLTMIALAVACFSLTIALWRTSPGEPAFKSPPPDPSTGTPIQDAAGGPSQKRVTEYLNVRILAKKLRPAGYNIVAGIDTSYVRTEEETCDDIAQLISQAVAPDSWQDNGGTAGEIHHIAGIMVVTQTPENMRSVHALLRRLEAATDDRDWLAGAKRQKVAGTIDSGKNADAATTKPIRLETGYFNIRRLVEEIRSSAAKVNPRQDSNLEVVNEIIGVVTSAVAPASWKDNGGTGIIRLVGEVLVIIQTPENLKACREVLVNLHLTGREDGSAPATTRSSDSQSGLFR